MSYAEEPQMLKELAQQEKLSHPTEDDEKPIEETANPRDPPSLCSVPRDIVPASEIIKLLIPRLLVHLPFQDVLNCRLICKDISEAIDKQLESNLAFSSSNNANNIVQTSPFINCRVHSCPTGPYIMEGIHLLDTPTIRQFLTKMETHTRNPFIGRCIRFGNYGDTSNNSEYWDAVIDLLKTFGHHIWHVELSDGHAPIGFIPCYKLIRECLSYLPNLESLEIAFMHDEISDEQVAVLVHVMNENPLPELPCLEKLEWNERKFANSFQDFIIAAYSQQIKALAAPMSVFYVEINEHTFPNLETLYLTNVENNEYLVDMKWCKLPNLKKLYLNLGGERCTSCGDVSNEAFNVKSVLQLVKQFQLEFLSIFLSPGAQLLGNRTLTVDEWKLESLKRFEIQHCKETSYEFLKCFTKLEHIHFFDIHHPVFPERRKGNQADEVGGIGHSAKNSIEIDKLVYLRQMYESSLWEIIPSLQVVTFKCVWDRQGANLIAVNDWYWREVYEYRKRGNSGGVVSKVVGFVKSMFSLT